MAWTTPTDRTTGYTVTAADWNIVEDNLTFLYGDTGWNAIPTLQNSWANFGAGLQTPGYRKVGNTVQFRGSIKSGTLTAGTLLFTMPPGYRPLNDTRRFPADNNGTYTNLSVDTTGAVRPVSALGNSVALSLDSIQYDII